MLPFTYEFYDTEDTGELTFNNVILTQPVGEHPIGTKFELAKFDSINCRIAFFHCDSNIWYRYSFNFGGFTLWQPL